MNSNKIVTTRHVEKDDCDCYIEQEELEIPNEKTRGIPVVLFSEENVESFLVYYKKLYPDWNLKAFKLIEVDWE